MKKLFAVLLSAALAASFISGCGASQEEKQQSETTAAVSSQPPDGQTEREMEGNMFVEGLPIVKEPMTFNAAIVKVSIDKVPTGDKQIMKDNEKETNVRFNWSDIPDTAWKEKINLMFASNDLPDLIIPERGDLDIIANAAALQPLNELLDKYAPTLTAYFKENPSVKSFVTAPDGNIYSLPRGSAKPAPWITLGENMWINTKWLEKIGKPMPTNLNELYEILKAFKTQDPNGNNKADEIPVLYSQPNGSFGQLNNLISCFGISDYANHIGVKDSKVYFVPAQKQYYEALQYINKLHKEGLLDPEGLTQNQQQMNAKGAADPSIAGVVMDYFVPNVVGSEKQWDYDVMPPLKGLDGRDPVIRGYPATVGLRPAGFIITKACKNPEVIVRWIDYMVSDKDRSIAWVNGPAGDIWEYTGDGKWKITDQHQQPRPGYASGEDYRFSTYVPYMGLDLYGFEDGRTLGPSDKLLQRKIDSVNDVAAFRDKQVMPDGFELPEIINERNNLSVDIENYLQSFFANSILKGLDEKAWEEHLKKLDTLKLSRYLEIHQSFYDRNTK